MTSLELWGGVECTIARIGEGYRDQVAETGHHDRIGDLDLVAGLGIRTLRYPVLWEALDPDIVPGRSWDWHDERLRHLRELGIDPIVGLLHHGSGPRDTSLLDPGFAARLAQHARAVAERFPWVARYTPVNEPLTTARFSALYGHWYPHRRSYPDFLRALVNQCRATVLAMEAIREVNPAAELVQTEDIGRVFSTEELAYQADHENGRRWLSLDLLFGRVGPDHAFWPVLLENGIAESELDTFLATRPPDLVGVNHYLTSDRYLDQDLFGYPPHLHGQNDWQHYADVEAVRVAELDGLTGPLPRIREVALRYPAPIAITEVHHGCSRDEQLRWFHEVWNAGTAARQEGLDIRAVTIWSLFGACDWNSLLTRTERIYEPGVYDARGREPRPTALAHAARALTETGRFDHPVLAQPGWWHRPERVYASKRAAPSVATRRSATLVLLAEPGPFTSECLRIARRRGLEMEAISPRPCASLAEACDRPVWGILDASGAATAPSLRRDGFLTWLNLAADADLPYVFLSRSDVFSGRPGYGFVERDRPSPPSIAGRRRAAQEELALTRHPRALVVRAGSLFGPGTELPGQGPVRTGAARGQEPSRHAGEFSYVPDLLHVVLDLLLDEENGIRHLVNDGPSSADARSSTGTGARLATERGALMPPMDSALAREAMWRDEFFALESRVALVAAE